METPAGHNQSDILFQYSWAIVRELDRINRSSQKSVSLHQRIHKLKAMAEPFLRNRDGDIKEDYEGWEEAWTNHEEAESPKEVRWKQLGMLIRLFHQEGVFEKERISFEDITYYEWNQQ